MAQINISETLYRLSSIKDSVSSVPKNSETTILTETPIANIKIAGIKCSSKARAIYRLYINSIEVDRCYTSPADLNWNENFLPGYFAVNAGQEVKITVYHYEFLSQDFEAILKILV